METNKCIIISNEACTANLSLLDQNVGRVGLSFRQAFSYRLLCFHLSLVPHKYMAQEFMVITHG